MKKTHKISVMSLLIASIAMFASSVILLIAFSVSTAFSDVFEALVASRLRYILSLLTGWFGFSLFEILLLCILPLFVSLAVLIILKKIKFSTLSLSIFFAVSISAFVFVSSFGVCYFCLPSYNKMGIERERVDRKELYECSEKLKSLLDSTLESVTFSYSGASVNPHGWNKTDNLIDRGFECLRNEYAFISKSHSVSKRIMLSGPMTYTHISGIYMPLTGEANVNTNYPDYVVVFSMAHEKAHQRGIASEDEANFIAFLALSASEDSYLQYCAYMSMYDYFLDSMYLYDSEMYFYLISCLDSRVKGEMYAYSVFFDRYRSSRASEFADSVNDTYIKAMGDDKGVDSYGLVVEIMCAYIKERTLQ